MQHHGHSWQNCNYKKAKPRIQLEGLEHSMAQTRAPGTLQAVLGSYRLLDLLQNWTPNLNSRSWTQ